MNRRTFALRGVGATIAAMIPAADAQSQDGPCILVAHSYGGSVITEAGTDPSAVGLVYIAAHMPDAGENEADDGKRFPSDVSKSNAIKKTPDGFTYPYSFLRISLPTCLRTASFHGTVPSTERSC